MTENQKACLWVFLGIPAFVLAFGLASYVVSAVFLFGWPLLLAALPVALIMGYVNRKKG